MIEFLKINDLALLDKAQIEFSGGFTVVTGETGAGKSVLLGALSILAGNRCPKEAIRKGADACRVEASLSFGDTSKIDAYLEENGVNPCEDGALVLSRAISREKSGRVFINGTLTSLSTLAGLGEFWIDFHGPGEPQKLFSQKNQLSMLDSFAGNEKLTEKYLALYAERADILRRIEAAKNSKRLSPDEMEFLQKQIAAIDALKLSPESVDELEEKSKLAEMASEIVEKSGAIVELLNGENGALGMISGANRLAGELRAAGDAAPEALVASLEALEEPTLILMHACAHNPTGCDLTCEVWERVGDILEGKGHLALLDMAYQGFARGIDEDAEAIRMLAARGLNFLASSSSSKNFGLYGERVGALHAVCASKQEAETVLTILKSIVRCEYSCPAEHGARIVAEVLGDPELSQQWRQAVDKMRRRVEAMRAELSAALKREDAEIPALDRQKGMFSFTGLTADEMKTLREEFAVYGVANGRICIAGLNLRNVGPAAHAIAEVLKRRG